MSTWNLWIALYRPKYPTLFRSPMDDRPRSTVPLDVLIYTWFLGSILKQQEFLTLIIPYRVLLIPHRPYYVGLYVDAAYCYRPSSSRSVGRSVCLPATLVSRAKTAEPIEMPFGLRTRVGPGNNVLDGGPDLSWEGQFWGEQEGASHCKV